MIINYEIPDGTTLIALSITRFSNYHQDEITVGLRNTENNKVYFIPSNGVLELNGCK